MNLTRRSVLSALALTSADVLSQAVVNGLPQTANDGPLSDPQRPGYHLLPARGWINDPCAPIFFRDQYHMFYQHNPHAAVWGDMHWGHATSPDMIHWKRLPVALAPTAGGADAQGCFTGSAILLNGHPAILYTGVRAVALSEATLADGHSSFRETQNLAIATDETLGTWRKLSQPAIPTPPPGMHVTGFRDPCPFRLGSDWYALIASGIPQVGGNVLLYKATTPDLSRWEYLKPLLQGQWTGKTGNNPVDTGEMWECPDFFPLGDPARNQYVLIYSTQRKTLWQSGVLDPKALVFHKDKTGQLDFGHDTFYAPKSQLDAHGNRILWGWIREKRPEAEYSRAGWSGMISLPRRLYLNNGDLHMEPASETQSLRGGANPDPAHLATGMQEFSCVLQASIAGGVPTPYIVADASGPLLNIRSASDRDPLTLRVNDVEIKLPERLPAQAGLHIFIDRSVIEVFIDSRFCFTHRFYSRNPTQPLLTLTLSGPLRITRAQSFALKSIWPT